MEEVLEELKLTYGKLAELQKECACREKAVALTKLDEASMWLLKSVENESHDKN